MNIINAIRKICEKEKVFSMFVRDPRFGLGRRDLGRRLMRLSGVTPENIVKAGRYDDLFHIPTNVNIDYLKEQLFSGDDLAKKWLPRLTGKDRKVAKALCKMWQLSEKEYRKLIKCEGTTEYKLSYAEPVEGTPLNELFKEGNYEHPLVDDIDFEQVPSLAMTKYLHAFSTREDTKERFGEYIQKVKEDKAKVHTTTSNVYDGYKTAVTGDWCTQSVETEAREVVANKIVDNATAGVEMNCIPIVDTSGSMGWYGSYENSLLGKAYSIAYGLATKSTYAPNQVISFSSRPNCFKISSSPSSALHAANLSGSPVFFAFSSMRSHAYFTLTPSSVESAGRCAFLAILPHPTIAITFIIIYLRFLGLTH